MNLRMKSFHTADRPIYFGVVYMHHLDKLWHEYAFYSDMLPSTCADTFSVFKIDHIFLLGMSGKISVTCDI